MQDPENLTVTASGDGEVPTNTDGDAVAGSLPTEGPTLKPREEATLVRSRKSWNSVYLTLNKPGRRGTPL